MLSAFKIAIPRTDIPPLSQQYPQEEKEEQHARAYPSVGDIRCRFIEVSLVDLTRRWIVSLVLERQYRIMQPTRPILVVSAETAAKGVSAGSGASMMDGWRLWRRVRGTGDVPEKVVRLVFVIVSLESNQLLTDAWVFGQCPATGSVCVGDPGECWKWWYVVCVELPSGLSQLSLRPANASFQSDESDHVLRTKRWSELRLNTFSVNSEIESYCMYIQIN